MTKRHKVLLYTIDDVSDHARECARSLGAQDQLELVSRTHEVFSSPTAEELDGVEAVLGEFMPVRGAEVDVMADAGVRLVASMSIGINHVDVAGLAARGVAVSNCPGYCAEDVALHAVALMLDLMRQVTMSNRDVLAGNWNPRFGREMRRPARQTCAWCSLATSPGRWCRSSRRWAWTSWSGRPRSRPRSWLPPDAARRRAWTSCWQRPTW